MHLKSCQSRYFVLSVPKDLIWFSCFAASYLLFQVVAHLSCVSEPSICLADVVTDSQLELLMRMCIMPSGTHSAHWGGPWASHSLTSLLQDLLQGIGNRINWWFVMQMFILIPKGGITSSMTVFRWACLQHKDILEVLACYVLNYSCTCGDLIVLPAFQIKWSRFVSCSALEQDTLLLQFLHPLGCINVSWQF